ncbi:hypothetical protein Tco_0162289 [Tanacetum coccineum]
MFFDSNSPWDYDSQLNSEKYLLNTRIEVKQFRETLLLHMGNVKKSLAERTRHKRQYDRRMNERQMQSRESKVVSSKALDASLVVTECGGTKSDEHITSSSSGTYITHAVDADIRPVNDQVPFAEVDSNTTPDSTNMCHRGGEIDQDAEQYKSKKVQSPKTRNSNKPIEPKIHTQKPGRQIVTGHRFSSNKSSGVHEKPNTPRSCLRWIPTGRIFNTVGLRWVPTGKTFTSSTTMVDYEPLNGSNKDITNPYECDQTLNVSASTLNLSVVPQRIHKQKQSPNSSQGVNEQQKRVHIDDPCHELLHRAPFLKEKKGVRFSVLYLQKKRNLLVFDRSHQHPSNFPMLVQSLNGSTYISLYFNSLDQSKMAIAYAIFEGENSESNVINTVEPGLSMCMKWSN